MAVAVPRPLATPAEVAAYRRVSESALTMERYRGIGPKFKKLGRRVFYDWDDVFEWINSRTQQRTDDPIGA